jgi:membrane protease YdiL (CAAX protease family)
MNPIWRSDIGKAAAAVPLALAISVIRRAIGRRTSGRRAIGRRASAGPSAPGRRRALLGCALAIGAPTAVLLDTARAGPVQVELPRSATGKVLLSGHVLATVVLEELLWRSPLTLPLGRTTKLVLAAVSASGFAAAHVGRDGWPNSRPHIVNTLGWTASALAARSVIWSALAHACYNLSALTLRRVPPRGES